MLNQRMYNQVITIFVKELSMTHKLFITYLFYCIFIDLCFYIILSKILFLCGNHYLVMDNDDVILLSDEDEKMASSYGDGGSKKEEVPAARDDEFGIGLEDNLYFGSDDFALNAWELDEPTTSTTSASIAVSDKAENAKAKKRSPEPMLIPDDEEVAPKRRKKRTKEEIEQEKMEKEANRIRRQIQASKNSKCEQYLFCHFSARILSLDDALKDELQKKFQEREIPNQIVYEQSNNQMMCIIWKKKRIEAYIGEGKLQSNESMEIQNCFCSVLSGDTFTMLAKARNNGVLAYIKDQVASHKCKNARPTLIILGKHSVRESTVNSIIFEAYERFKAQFRFVQDALDFAFAIVQMHRALAKNDKKSEKLAEAEELGTHETHFLADKGISDGPGILTDWWTRMLDRMHRMTEEQKRAIVKAHPNPIRLMDRLLDPNNSPGNSMFLISEIELENGRRLGPVLAQKIYKMLTSLDGTEQIEMAGN